MAERKLTFMEGRRTRFDVLRTWFPRLTVAMLFLFIGANKFTGHSEWIRIFDRIGFGQWFRYFTGVLQIAGGVLVLIPRTFPVGILLIACTMLGAMAAWIFILGAPFNALIPGALLLGVLGVGGKSLAMLAAGREQK